MTRSKILTQDDIVYSPEKSRTEMIAGLNDRARLGLDRTARVMFTANLLAKFNGDTRAHDIIAQAKIMQAMRSCSFSEDSPERDMSWFNIDDIRVMIKIDYYDQSLEYGSEDPADAAKTRRVITLMAPEDY